MVLDASAVVEWLLGSERGEAVGEALRASGSALLHAPDLLDVEVAHVLRRLAHAGAVGEARASGAIELLARLPVDRHPAGPLIPRVWALRASLSAYDAAYVALAEALECPLLTCDARLAAAHGHGAEVRVVGQRAATPLVR